MSKKVKGVFETTNTEGNISLLGLGVGGSVQRTNINVTEYSNQLNSIRKTRESFPDAQFDESFLRIAPHIWNQLSDSAKRDYCFILTEKDEIPQLKYKAGTHAEWAVPYFNEMLRTYLKTVEEKCPSRFVELPLFNCLPVAPFIVLSQFSGLLLFVQNRTEIARFGTANKPFVSVIEENGLKMNPGPGSYVRQRGKPEDQYVWLIHYGSNSPNDFSLERGAEHGSIMANEDLLEAKLITKSQ